MGENSNIAWTDNTWNPWWGCTEVGPGCDSCYARIFSNRMNKAKWGDHEPRMRTSRHVWDSLAMWDRKAAKSGKPCKVFCASMADFFDNHPDCAPWRALAWTDYIKPAKNLRLQILTKRVSNIPKMLPADWGPDYAHVGFMITVVNQQEADRDIPRLQKIKRDHGVTWIGLSVEPMVGAIDIKPHTNGLDWVVIGGESERPLTAKCRAYDMDAAFALLEQTRAAGVSAFHKQLGSRPIRDGQPFAVDHWKGEIPEQWPQEFRVQEFPAALLH